MLPHFLHVPQNPLQQIAHLARAHRPLLDDLHRVLVALHVVAVCVEHPGLEGGVGLEDVHHRDWTVVQLGIQVGERLRGLIWFEESEKKVNLVTFILRLNI